MNFRGPIVESEARQFLENFELSSLTDNYDVNEQFGWLVRVMDSCDPLFDSTASILSQIMQSSTDIDADKLVQVLEVLQKKIIKCKKETCEHFIMITVLSHLACVESVVMKSDNLLKKIRIPIYSDQNSLSLLIEILKTKLVPKMKSLADVKDFSKALALWRAVVRFTRFESIPTSVTNKILLVATMAFKETDFQVHVKAFDAWKSLIEALPLTTLKKDMFINLLLNPLNRSYRDTDSVVAPYKFSAWWQLVISLESHIDVVFDTILVPLIQKVFIIPVTRGRTSMPSVFASPTRQLSEVAYSVIALILYDGNSEILNELTSIQTKLCINSHRIADKCFAGHVPLFEEVLNLIYHNVSQKVTPPPKNFLFVLVKLLLSRAATLHAARCNDLVRVFVVNVFKYIGLKSSFDSEQMLSIYTDIIIGLPQKLIASNQLNLKEGTTEAPLTTLAAFYVETVSHNSNGNEKSRKKYRGLFKAMIQRFSTETKFLISIQRLVSSLKLAEPSFFSPIWCDIAERLTDVVTTSHNINQGGVSSHDFSALVSTLRFPFQNDFPLTSDVIKIWTKLFTVFSVEASLVKDVGTNQHIEELCVVLLEDISSTEFDLNRLMLSSQAFENIVKQLCLTETASKLDNLSSLMKCLSLIFTKGSNFIQNEDELTANCFHFINVLNIVNHLIQNSKDLQLCKEIMVSLVPHVVPLIESSRNKAVLKETALAQIETPLTTALTHFVELFVARAKEIPENTRLMDIVRKIIDVSSNHWKRSIRDPVSTIAKTMSVPIDDLDQSLSSLSQFVSVEDAVPPQAPKSPIQRTTATKRRSSRKSDTKKSEEEEFTPIKSTKKKTIFTEHQLEKQAEAKIIPSLYQDLSQSVDKNINEATNGVPPKIEGPLTFQDITPKKEEKPEQIPDAVVPTADEPDKNETEKCSKVRRSLAGKDTEEEGVRPLDSDVRTPDENDLNLDNGEPACKKKKRFSYSETDDLCEPVPLMQDLPSIVKMVEKIQEKFDKNGIEEQTESPIKPLGARKRKISSNLDSPVTSKLQQRGFLHNSPSSRSRKMLEAAQARQSVNPVTDTRFMMAGCTPRHNNTINIITDIPATPQTMTDERPGRVTFHLPATPTASTFSPSSRRSILKRASTGASSKRVSFSKSNEVCSFVKNSRLSTSESLNPPIMINDDTINSSYEETNVDHDHDDMEATLHKELEAEAQQLADEASGSVRILEESFHSAAEAEADLTEEQSMITDPTDTGVDEQSDDVNVERSTLVLADPRTDEIVTEDSMTALKDLIGGRERAAVIDFLSSPDFLSSLSSEERCTFVSRMLQSVASFVR